jgi:hypothetical protein
VKSRPGRRRYLRPRTGPFTPRRLQACGVTQSVPVWSDVVRAPVLPLQHGETATRTASPVPRAGPPASLPSSRADDASGRPAHEPTTKCPPGPIRARCAASSPRSGKDLSGSGLTERWPADLNKVAPTRPTVARSSASPTGSSIRSGSGTARFAAPPARITRVCPPPHSIGVAAGACTHGARLHRGAPLKDQARGGRDSRCGNSARHRRARTEGE